MVDPRDPDRPSFAPWWIRSRWLLPLAALLLASSAAVTTAPPQGNRPPTIAIGLEDGASVVTTTEVRFRVTARDPDGDPLSLRLLNPPPGLIFDPVLDEPGPVSIEARWLVTRGEIYHDRRELAFEATDGVHRVRELRLVHVLGVGDRSSIVTGDVTGDERPDLVGLASHADVEGVVDVGAAYVWSDSTAPSGLPTAVLTVPGAAPSTILGFGPGDTFAPQTLQLVDVTGDGKRDIVIIAYHAELDGVHRAGAIYIWKGGIELTGRVAPYATARTPTALPGGLWVYSDFRQSFWIEDVTGDAIPDLVAAGRAQMGSVMGGGLYVWQGGPGLSGTVRPHALLRSPDPTTSSGVMRHRVADVTGDGINDVIAGNFEETVGSSHHAGAIHVWEGGSGLKGTLLPSATLADPSGAGVGLGGVSHLLDLTGDGILDIVAVAFCATVGGVQCAGAIQLWEGGTGLSGPSPPKAILVAPNPSPMERLGSAASRGALWFADVTGDGALDVVAGADEANVGGVKDAGAVYVWSGAAGLAGTVAATATLTVPGAVEEDHLGSGWYPFLLADVTGDGIADVTTSSRMADVGGTVDAGAVHVWAGGAGLAGALAPTATLFVSGTKPQSYMDLERTRDVTGDGILDVIALSSWADQPGARDAGAIYVWKGGAGLKGSLAPTATLRAPDALPGDYLGRLSGDRLRLVDLTGDGLVDVVSGSYAVDSATATDAGALYVWAGGAGLTGKTAPTATLRLPTESRHNILGWCSGPSLQFADVSDDGILDLVTGAFMADIGGVSDAGGVFIWNGGPSLQGSPPPSTALLIPGHEVVAGDRLGIGRWHAIQLADLTDDGIPDILAGASVADTAGVKDAGAIFVWKAGGSTLTSRPRPLWTLTVPNACEEDRLGE